MRLDWLIVSDGSDGSLTPAVEVPGRRGRKALELDGKAGGAAPKRSAKSSVAAGLLCQLGREAQQGRTTHRYGSLSQGQRPARAAGDILGQSFSRVRPTRAERLARGSVTREKATMATIIHSGLLSVGLSVLPKDVAKTEDGNKI